MERQVLAVLLGAAATVLLALSPVDARVVTVSSSSGLSSALANAAAGDEISLADGKTFSGSFSLRKSGTSSAPIVITGERALSAKFTGTLTIAASNVILTNVVVQGGGLVISGDNIEIARNKFMKSSANGKMINVLKSTGGVKIHHNDFQAFTGTKSGSIYAISLSIEGSQGDAARSVEIYRNYFHDFPSKPDNYSALSIAGIGVGDTPADSVQRVSSYVHHNLFVNMGDAEGMSIKSRGNRFEYNTLVGGKTQIRVRQGGDNTIVANWCENIRDVSIGGGGNVLRWNKFVGSTQAYRLWAGEEPAGSTKGNGIVQAKNTVMIGNTGKLIVGDYFSSRSRQTIKAAGTVVKGHTGSIEKKRTEPFTPVSSAGERALTPVKLTTAQVGPAAP